MKQIKPKRRVIIRKPSTRAADRRSQKTSSSDESKSNSNVSLSEPLKLFENSKIRISVHEKPSDTWSLPKFVAMRTELATMNGEAQDFETIEGAFGQMIDWLRDEFKFSVDMTDDSHNVIGYKGNKKGTMLFKGAHSNYAEFKAEIDETKVEGCVSFFGETVYIEANRRRFKASLKPLIEQVATLAVRDV